MLYRFNTVKQIYLLKERCMFTVVIKYTSKLTKGECPVPEDFREYVVQSFLLSFYLVSI